MSLSEPARGAPAPQEGRDAATEAYLASITGLAESERVEALLVTDGTLPVLRVVPQLGRRFGSQTGRPSLSACVSLPLPSRLCVSGHTAGLVALALRIRQLRRCGRVRA